MSQQQDRYVTRAEYETLVEQHEQVLAEVEEQKNLIEALRRKVDNLQQDVNDLQRFDGAGAEFGGWRDRRVVASLTAGREYTAQELLARYETRIGMTDKEKIRKRVKRITSSPAFENTDHGKFRFVGTDDK